MNAGDLQFCVEPDGACAPNCGAAWIFLDPKYGPSLRKLMNNHMADRFDFYGNKVSFPYVRQVGVKGKVETFEEGEEDRFLQFLRSNEACYLWSDSEDLQIMSNLYQMRIKVISIKSDNDDHTYHTYPAYLLSPKLREIEKNKVKTILTILTTLTTLTLLTSSLPSSEKSKKIKSRQYLPYLPHLPHLPCLPHLSQAQRNRKK